MKRILVISHNPFSMGDNNGRTLTQLFNMRDAATVAQIYLHDGVPDAVFCDKFYCVTDFDILYSLLKLRQPGKRVAGAVGQPINVNSNEQKVYREGSKRKSTYYLVRNSIWRLNTWFNKRLKSFINEFTPDVIFYMAGDYVFSMRVALKVAKYCNARLISYWGDDYYLNRKLKEGFFGRHNDRIYRKTTEKVIKNSTFVCLTDLMRIDYSRAFGKEGYCLRTASSLTPFEKKARGGRLVMSYLGNISFNRYKSLIDIANVIEECGLPIDFYVYSGEKREWILSNVRNVNCLNYMGGVSYDKVIDVMRNSDCVVHVEGFEEDSVSRVKYSFSTKIADSLSCGRCLFAYGPDTVASIRYLQENDCAVVAENKEEIKDKLLFIINNEKQTDRIIERALEVSRSNHNSENNQNYLESIIEKTC